MTRLDDLRCQYLESLIALIAPATDPALFDRIERLLWATDEPQLATTVTTPSVPALAEPVDEPDHNPLNTQRATEAEARILEAAQRLEERSGKPPAVDAVAKEAGAAWRTVARVLEKRPPSNDLRPLGWSSPVDKLLQDEPEPPPKPSGRNLGGGYTREPIPCDVCAEPHGRGAGMAAHVKGKHPDAVQDWRGKWVLPDVHVHRWILDKPNGEGVPGECECGARRIDPAVIGGDQAVSFKRIKSVCPDCGGVAYADRNGPWCNSCNKAVAVVS